MRAVDGAVSDELRDISIEITHLKESQKKSNDQIKTLVEENQSLKARLKKQETTTDGRIRKLEDKSDEWQAASATTNKKLKKDVKKQRQELATLATNVSS